ncbi:MAG: ABC transporter ATP-binding protein [Flavobacteriales bacterium]|nr:ABC transporter ATP-binding protein [Flavobacteriales bacterium]MBK6752806.1 ABC transporter ATP-binding protein [Flavobacteriales bacterium]MBK7085208.1 ABC transporter ATP-binding protein [Flavobacteriales bacterium]MBK7754041.1 ABC transporter ATP-binding protein [Flavobacteriales bacterium]MBK9075858.1 ABC transporter ATP-binding protein [Flavobacteriales bacterium]
MIHAIGIRKRFGDLDVLKGVELHVAKGEVVSIVGASGAGKTTLLQILGTLEHADQGQLNIGGTDIAQLGTNALSAFRNKHIGFVFQFHHLLPEFSALENVMMPGLIAGKSRSTCAPRAVELLTRLNVAARKEHKPAQLSGGEQQRVAVARALFNAPDVILADEPSGNLDSAHARELHQLFFDLRTELSQTFVIVTHNEELAEMADRRLVIKDGVI